MSMFADFRQMLLDNVRRRLSGKRPAGMAGLSARLPPRLLAEAPFLRRRLAKPIGRRRLRAVRTVRFQARLQLFDLGSKLGVLFQKKIDLGYGVLYAHAAKKIAGQLKSTSPKRKKTSKFMPGRQARPMLAGQTPKRLLNSYPLSETSRCRALNFREQMRQSLSLFLWRLISCAARLGG